MVLLLRKNCLGVFFASQPGEEFVDVVEVFGEFDSQTLLVGQFGAGVVAGVVAVESIETEIGVELVAYFHVAHKDVGVVVVEVVAGVAVAEGGLEVEFFPLFADAYVELAGGRACPGLVLEVYVNHFYEVGDQAAG